MSRINDWKLFLLDNNNNNWSTEWSGPSIFGSLFVISHPPTADLIYCRPTRFIIEWNQREREREWHREKLSFYCIFTTYCSNWFKNGGEYWGINTWANDVWRQESLISLWNGWRDIETERQNHNQWRMERVKLRSKKDPLVEYLLCKWISSLWVLQWILTQQLL